MVETNSKLFSRGLALSLTQPNQRQQLRRWNQILHQDPTIKAYVILISNNVDEAMGDLR